MQVNIDVLVRLLQPVPFVAGLPAPDRGADTGSVMATVDDSPSKTRKQDCDGQSSGCGALETNCIHVEAERRKGDASSERGADEAMSICSVDPQSSEAEIVVLAECECAVYNGDGHRDNRCDNSGGGEGESAGVEVLERRAAPVVEGPAATLAEALGGIANGETGGQDNEEKRKSSGGARFYSYDETHQVMFTSLIQ